MCVCVCVYVSRGSILCSVVPCASKCVCVYVRGVFCDPLSLWVCVCDRVCVCVCVCRGSVLWSLELLCVCVGGVIASEGSGGCGCVGGVFCGPLSFCVCVSGEWPHVRGQVCACVCVCVCRGSGRV